MHTRFATNNLKTSRTRFWVGGDLKPGYGTADLHVGQSGGDVEQVLGGPDEKVSSGEQFYYRYLANGVDVDLGRSLARVKRLFFFDTNIEGHSNKAPVLVQGMQFGATRSQIVKRFGAPNLTGGPVRVGRRMKSWVCYKSGIEFDFDGRDRLVTIIIFDPQLLTQQAKAPSSGS
ncbi:MAG: hypothetical protein WA655_24100 [Candidatus Korobacteraceae bacterium]